MKPAIYTNVELAPRPKPEWLTDEAIIGWDLETNQISKLTYDFTRASTGLMSNAEGVYEEFNVDELRRIDTVGLLLESAKTNYIPNSSMAGAAISETEALDGIPSTWHTSKITGTNGVSGAITAIGTWNGLPSLTIHLWGDATISDAQIMFNSTTQMPVLQGDTVSMGFNIQVIDGDLTNISFRTRITEQNASKAYLTKQLDVFSPISTTQVSNSYTISNAASVFAVAILELSVSGAFDVTFEISAPFFTETTLGSPILTTTAPIERAEDVLTLHLPTFPHDLTIVFDDDSTQTFLTKTGNYQLPASDLSRTLIKRIYGKPSTDE